MTLLLGDGVDRTEQNVCDFNYLKLTKYVWIKKRLAKVLGGVYNNLSEKLNSIRRIFHLLVDSRGRILPLSVRE